jgi:hypothetical protein
LDIKYLAQAQRRCFAREDEIRDENSDGVPKEYILRTFIPPSLVDIDEYWHHVAAKCFVVSTQLGAPAFFLTFTTNLHWLDYQALKRDDDVFADSAMGSVTLKTILSALMKFIQKKKIFGIISAYLWRIEYQRLGLPHAHILFWSDSDTQDVHAVETVINVRYPKDSPFPDDQGMVTDFRQLVDAYQIHYRAKRCRLPSVKCCFGCPQKLMNI